MHNKKRVVREVMMKKMSDVDCDGVVRWSVREVTTLACLYKKSLGQQGANTELMTDTPESGGTNQKRTKLFNIEKNQLPPTLGLNNASIEDI